MPGGFHSPFPHPKHTFVFHALGFARVGECMGIERNGDNDHFTGLLGEIGFVFLARVNNGGMEAGLLLEAPPNQFLFGLAQGSCAGKVHEYGWARQARGPPNVAGSLRPGRIV